MRVLLGLAFVLVLLVALCSATLRLAASGVGCTPWPTCYAQANAAAPADDAVPAWQHTLRLTHRVSATVAGLVFVFIVAFGFSRWSLSQRVAGASLWLLALALALVGRITPSHLMDRNLYPFATLQPTGVPDAGGDIAFDEEPCAPPAVPITLHRAEPAED